MIHRGPIPAPIHGAQRITERLVATDRRRRRRGDEEWGGCSAGWDGEGRVVCRDEGVKVERGGVGFGVAVHLFVGTRRDVARARFGFAGAGLGRRRRVGFVVPSDARVSRRSGREMWKMNAQRGLFHGFCFPGFRRAVVGLGVCERRRRKEGHGTSYSASAACHASTRAASSQISSCVSALLSSSSSSSS